MAEAGLWTEHDADRVAAILDWSSGKDWMAPALCFPYRDVDGEALMYDRPLSNGGVVPMVYVRLKPKKPPRVKNSKHVKKYLGPINVPQSVYIPPGMEDVVRNEKETLWLTEGEKKALSVVGAGHWCVGLPGVWGWKEAGSEELGALLNEFKFRGRQCVICFDSDMHSNRQVMLAAQRLAQALYRKGADNVLVTSPPEGWVRPDGSVGKVGVDDYIADGGQVEDLAKSGLVVESEGSRIFRIKTLDMIEPQKTEWIWDRYIPRGEFVLLDGEPGKGKSQILADLIARWTRGWPMPPDPLDSFSRLSGGDSEGLRIVVLPAEDSESKTIRPRYEAAGVDLSRVLWLGSDESGSLIRLPEDLGTLERICVDFDADVLVLDPLMAYIGGKVDTHSDASTRTLLAPLTGLANRNNMTVLAVRHFNKKSGESALNRGGGSIAFAATARVVMVAGDNPRHDEEGGPLFCFSVVKNNFAPRGVTLGYDCETIENSYGGTSRIRWKSEMDWIAADDVAGVKKTREGGKLKLCEQLITESLNNGPMRSAELMKTVAEKAEVSERTVRDACARLGVVRAKNGLKEWWCRLTFQRFSWEKGGARKVKKRKRG